MRGLISPGKIFLLLVLLPAAKLSAQTSGDCNDSLAQGSKRWLLGFGHGSDVYNGLHLSLNDGGTTTNGISLTFCSPGARAGDQRVTRHNGLLAAGVFANVDTLNGIGLGTFYVGGRAINGAAISLIGRKADRMNGLQLGGILAISEKETNGLAIAGIAAGSNMKMNGVAIGGLAAGGEEAMNGLVIGGLTAVSFGELNGVAFSGIWTGVDERSAGLLFSFGFSKSEYHRGLKIASVTTGEYVKGASIGIACFEAYSNGVKLGAYNYSNDHNGLQIGIVNRTATLSGLQLGLLNIVSENPKGLRVLPLINFRQHARPARPPRRSNTFPEIPGSIIVRTQDKHGITREEQRLNGKKHGLSRTYREKELKIEARYSNDTLLESRSYSGHFKKPEGGYLLIITRGDHEEEHRVTQKGDTLWRTIDGKKQGRSLLSDESWSAVHIYGVHKDDSLIERYAEYTGPEVRLRDKIFGKAVLKKGDRLPSYEEARAAGMQGHFDYGYGSEGISYIFTRRRNGVEEEWNFALERSETGMRWINMRRRDTSFHMDRRKRLIETSVYHDRENSYRLKWRKNGHKKLEIVEIDGAETRTLYYRRNRIRYTERADSLFIRRARNCTRKSSDGVLSAKGFFKNGKERSSFTWNGNQFQNGFVYRKDGSVRIKACGREKGMRLEYYHRSGKLKKTKDHRKYGPLKRYIHSDYAIRNCYYGCCGK